MSQKVMLTAYALAHFGKSLLWHSSTLVFAFYLTEVIGLPPRQMGRVLAASLVVNAVCDLGFGWILGRWVRDLRSAARAQALGAGLACLSFMAFAAAGAASTGAGEAAAIAALIAFRIGYSLLDVPQNTVLAFIAPDDTGRTKMATLRYASAGFALLIVALSLAPWLAHSAPAARAVHFFIFAACLTPITLVTALILWAAAARSRPLAVSAQPLADGSPEAVRGMWLPLASILVYSSCMPLFTKLEAYFVAYSPAQSGAELFMASVAIGQIAAQLVWFRLAGQTDLVALYRYAAVGLGLLAIAFASLAALGGAVLLGLAALYGGASSGLLASIWALLARAAAAMPTKATLWFGRFTFCSKIAQASSALVLGEALSALNYTEASQQGLLILVMALGPALTAAACSALGAFFYREHRLARAAVSM